jgi:alkylation response protein AidB-like acyl-CoA dehydrogenase
MDVTLNEDEALLQETASRIGDHIGPAPADTRVHKETNAWKELAQAGLLGLAMIDPEESTVGPGVASALVAEALAGQPCAIPFVGSAVLAPALLVAAGAAREVLAEIESGAFRVGVGLSVDLRSACTESAGEVVAWDSADAETVITLNTDKSPQAISLPPDAAPCSTDLTRDLFRLDAATGTRRSELGQSITDPAWMRWQALALTTLAADLCGVMKGALDLAVEHANSRIQFGAPIGSFQAIKHLCADALVHLETSRSAMLYAAWSVDRAGPQAALRAARVAKAFSGEAAIAVTETCIQVHGGVGITWENRAHLFLRRALMDRQTLGDEMAQIAVLSRER